MAHVCSVLCSVTDLKQKLTDSQGQAQQLQGELRDSKKAYQDLQAKASDGPVSDRAHQFECSLSLVCNTSAVPLPSHTACEFHFCSCLPLCRVSRLPVWVWCACHISPEPHRMAHGVCSSARFLLCVILLLSHSPLACHFYFCSCLPLCILAGFPVCLSGSVVPATVSCIEVSVSACLCVPVVPVPDPLCLFVCLHACAHFLVCVPVYVCCLCASPVCLCVRRSPSGAPRSTS